MKSLFKSAGLSLSDDQEKKFTRYYELLIEWNKKMNLTSITEWEEVKVKHFLDSVMVARLLSFEKGYNKKCIDVGTGAGFPGIPLAIYFPEVEFVLLDSLNKRVEFLNKVIEQLGLENVKTIHGRAEDYGRDKNYREKFDYSVSRAVANISTLSEYCIPFVKVGGRFISYKSEKSKEELEEFGGIFSLLGCSLCENYEFFLPGTDWKRNFLVIEKEKHTESKYPRKTGKPSKQPLR